jgi:hypothetical protein
MVEMLIKCNRQQQEQGKQNQLTVVEVIHMSCVKEANKLDTRRSRWNVDVSGRQVGEKGTGTWREISNMHGILA